MINQTMTAITMPIRPEISCLNTIADNYGLKLCAKIMKKLSPAKSSSIPPGQPHGDYLGT